VNLVNLDALVIQVLLVEQDRLVKMADLVNVDNVVQLVKRAFKVFLV